MEYVHITSNFVYCMYFKSLVMDRVLFVLNSWTILFIKDMIISSGSKRVIVISQRVRYNQTKLGGLERF